jgi:hypothetical protein
MPEGGSAAYQVEGIADELDDWIKDDDSRGSDVTHADLLKNFPTYSGTYTGTNITISLVSVLPGYFVPLEGVKAMASRIWSVCQNGGSQTDALGNFVDISIYTKWGNCEKNQTLSGIWNLESAAVVLCIWNSTPTSFTTTTTTTTTITTTTPRPLCQGWGTEPPVTCVSQS